MGSDVCADMACDGDCDQVAYLDQCNVCDDEISNDCEEDCAGFWGGPDNIPNNGDEAMEDNCEVCDAIPSNNCTQDCAGTWGGEVVVDDCGVCGGNDECAQCDEGVTYDCQGACGGNAFEDCGICNFTYTYLHSDILTALESTDNTACRFKSCQNIRM
jgi:hypothetical protein